MAAATGKTGEIRADGIYTLHELQQRMGLGQAALRTARRNGLPIKRIGRRGYVLGRDLIEYVDRAGN